MLYTFAVFSAFYISKEIIRNYLEKKINKEVRAKITEHHNRQQMIYPSGPSWDQNK